MRRVRSVLVIASLTLGVLAGSLTVPASAQDVQRALQGSCYVTVSTGSWNDDTFAFATATGNMYCSFQPQVGNHRLEVLIQGREKFDTAEEVSGEKDFGVATDQIAVRKDWWRPEVFHGEAQGTAEYACVCFDAETAL